MAIAVALVESKREDGERRSYDSSVWRRRRWRWQDWVQLRLPVSLFPYLRPFPFLSVVCVQTLLPNAKGLQRNVFIRVPSSKICTSLLFFPFWFYVSSSVDPNPNRQTSTLTTTNNNKFLCVCLVLRSQITASFFHKFQFNNPTYLIFTAATAAANKSGPLSPDHPSSLSSVS